MPTLGYHALAAGGDFGASYFRAMDDLGAAFCICDSSETILYANALYRSVFLPSTGVDTVDFVEAITAGIRSGRGIKLESSSLDDFMARVRARRRQQTGAFSFETDTTDGRWWWVTDSKLRDGTMIAVAQDITALKHKEFILRSAHASALEEASTDYLTGVSNRRHGFKQAEEMFARFTANDGSFALAVLDIDHFKRINDTYGHPFGDRVLRHVATLVNAQKRPQDSFSRIGGEEFLLASSDPAAMEKALRKVLQPVQPFKPSDDAEALHFTVSVGLAFAELGETFGSVFHRADRALYTAKSRGRDRIERATT